MKHFICAFTILLGTGIAATAAAQNTVAVAAPMATEVTIDAGHMGFQGQTARPDAATRRTLDHLAAAMVDAPELHLHVVVSGDARSRDPLLLSTLRADAIVAYLGRRGVARKRVHAFGDREVGEQMVSLRWSRTVAQQGTTPPRILADR